MSVSVCQDSYVGSLMTLIRAPFSFSHSPSSPLSLSPPHIPLPGPLPLAQQHTHEICTHNLSFDSIESGLCLPACLPVCLPACLAACLRACLSVCLPAFLPACLPTCLSLASPLPVCRCSHVRCWSRCRSSFFLLAATTGDIRRLKTYRKDMSFTFTLEIHIIDIHTGKICRLRMYWKILPCKYMSFLYYWVSNVTC